MTGLSIRVDLDGQQLMFAEEKVRLAIVCVFVSRVRLSPTFFSQLASVCTRCRNCEEWLLYPEIE